MERKYIEQPARQPKPQPNDSFWQVMKPFVKFGFKTMGIIVGALWSIVKIIPKPSEFKTEKRP